MALSQENPILGHLFSGRLDMNKLIIVNVEVRVMGFSNNKLWYLLKFGWNRNRIGLLEVLAVI